MCDKSLLATGNAVAIAIAVLALCVLPAATTTATDSYVNLTDSGAPVENINIAAEVQQFKIAALTRIDNFLQYKLPTRMQAEGEAIRAETVKELEHCAQLATSKEEIWRFRQCGAEQLGNTMKSLALLVEQAYNGGAMAMYAIWLNLLILVPLFF